MIAIAYGVTAWVAASLAFGLLAGRFMAACDRTPAPRKASTSALEAHRAWTP